jgi:DNA-binding NarL/FixJ family response regulator
VGVSETRVVIVDDHDMFREGLRATLTREGFRVVHEATDSRSLLQWLDQRIDFDVILVDIAMPGSDGLALVRELRRREVAQPAVIVSMHLDIDMIVAGLAAGARGYVFKNLSLQQLCEAIRTVLAGRQYVPPTVDLARVNAMLAEPEIRRQTSPLAALSPREREVCDLLIRGHGNAQAAAELCISAKTVETHRTRIFKKLGVHSLAELIRLAARHNLLGPTVERAPVDSPL